MGETTDQIERQIEQKRNQLNQNFNELEQKVKAAMDWRRQFDERPGTMLAVAFGGGVLLSAMVGGSRSASRKSYSDWTERRAAGRDYSSSPSTAAYKSSLSEAPRKPSQARENLEALSGALLSVAISRVTNLINRYLPGFEREFTRVKSSKGVDRTFTETPTEHSWPSASAASMD